MSPATAIGSPLSLPIAIDLAAHDDFEAWRDHARSLLRARIPPGQVIWNEPGQYGDLLASASGATFSEKRIHITVSRDFLELGEKVICHNDSARFALLYRLLWRHQQHPRLLQDVADADVRRAQAMAKEVRRDIHKMRAFVRFRLVEEGKGEERYVAWFEPEHHIIRANVRFFVDRFANMRWSILTPDLSIHWDGALLSETAGATARDAPQGDPVEDMWTRYYASIFNPARVKVGAMLKEMPRRYWKNMPETAIVPSLIAGARARESAMIAAGEDVFPTQFPESLGKVAEEIAACRRCSIGCKGTRAVSGDGALDGGVMVIGEQPGDEEEKAGKPFVGPAGQLLNRYLDEADIDRGTLYVTNAVKHFKFEPRGPRRIHQRPTAGEIDTCRFWLDAERSILKPRTIVALGASAARAVLGRTPSVQNERGRPIALPGGTQLWITVHPSFLLRAADTIQKREKENFLADWVKIREAAFPPMV
ncbi:MAG: UdgX family uracil-DNA binding protein [Sphingobium sp.]